MRALPQVEAVPKFSKFIHGCATLLANRVDLVPFWLPQMETDIRKSPSRNLNVGIERPASMIQSGSSSRPDTPGSRSSSPPQYHEPVSEDEFEGGDDDEREHVVANDQHEADSLGLPEHDPRIREARAQREQNIKVRQRELEKQRAENPGGATSDMAAAALAAQRSTVSRAPGTAQRAGPPKREDILSTSTAFDKNYFSKLTPKNIQRLWRAKYSRDANEGDDEDETEEGSSRRDGEEGRDEEEPQSANGQSRSGVEYVTHFSAQPGKKVSVPVRIEPKVYFANERTFLKWLEFSVFISALAVGLLNFSKPGDTAGLVSSCIFTVVALFCIAYSGAIYTMRAIKIRRKESSNVYFDAM